MDQEKLKTEKGDIFIKLQHKKKAQRQILNVKQRGVTWVMKQRNESWKKLAPFEPSLLKG